MKITKKLVRETIKSNSQKLHQKSWYDFQNLPEVRAVNFALLQYENQPKNIESIIDEAKSYLNDINYNNLIYQINYAN